MRSIRPRDLMLELKANALAGENSMIWGSPGIGKSEIVYQLAQELGAELYELRANLFDPVDVRGGLKVVEQEDGTYQTRYGIPEDYPPSETQAPVVFFIDELTTASKATQAALLQLLLNRRIGTYKLPVNTVIVAAGNRARDRAAVHEMPMPVKDRFDHFTLEPNADDFCAHALQNDVDPSIVGFIRYRPQLLNDPDPANNAFPTPRSWTRLSRKLPHMNDEFYGVASKVGDGAAGEYLAFRKLFHHLPEIDKIIASPGSVSVPAEPSAIYAVAGALAARADATTVKPILKYLRRLAPEYQVVAVRDIIGKDKKLVTNSEVQAWITDNSTVVL